MHLTEAEDRALSKGLTEEQRNRLAQVNGEGIALMRRLLEEGSAIAFLGAGASAPLYPTWDRVIRDLLETAREHLTDQEIATCATLASRNPDAVVEVVRRRLGPIAFHALLREKFAVRRDQTTGKTWTTTHELVARCNLRGVITTNYDPGIVNARMAVRPDACGTGFASWNDEDALDRWRTGDVFGDDELPVLFAHGRHNQPDAVVLAATEYRRAYGGKLARVLASLMDRDRLVWIGFSFADQRIAAILREIAEGSGTYVAPGQEPRHVAIMPWDPAHVDSEFGLQDPGILRDVSEIQFGSRLILYPAPGDDHSALTDLLAAWSDPRYPAITRSARAVVPAPEPVSQAQPEPLPPSQDADPVFRWVHGGTRIENFTGREEERARMGRWLSDLTVKVVGVSAWGGAGKTALATEWLNQSDELLRARGLRGVFAWSFYEDSSEEAWANALLAWVEETFGVEIGEGPLASRVAEAVGTVPLVLYLDGLEVAQEGPTGTEFGRLLHGTLRGVLTNLCLSSDRGFAVLTSRFPFADLDRYDGGAVRILDVPPLTPAEGCRVLAAGAGAWLSEQKQRQLVAAVDGHALAITVLAGALAASPESLDELSVDLESASRTDVRVSRVMRFYADRLTEADKLVVGVVSLFQRPVAASTVLRVGQADRASPAFEGWTAGELELAVRQRLRGLVSWHTDHMVSAHPLVRDAFREYALTPARVQFTRDLVLSGMPAGRVETRDAALRLVELVELLLDAGDWRAAEQLYEARAESGWIWNNLPAPKLGERCAGAFVSTEARRRESRTHLSDRSVADFLLHVGASAVTAGDYASGEAHLRDAAEEFRALGDHVKLSITLRNRAECLRMQGETARSREAAQEALDLVMPDGLPVYKRNAHARFAESLDLAGETARADDHHRTAFEIERAERLRASWSNAELGWAALLLRTRREDAARRLLEVNLAWCRRRKWRDQAALCEVLLSRCDLADGYLDSAGERLREVVGFSRETDAMEPLTAGLLVLADWGRRTGALEQAETWCTEVMNMAAPRNLVPAQAAALTARALIRAQLSKGPGDEHLARGRDDADHALRLSTTVRGLPWSELDAVTVLADFDAREGAERGRRAEADALRSHLVPEGLTPEKDIVDRLGSEPA